MTVFRVQRHLPDVLNRHSQCGSSVALSCSILPPVHADPKPYPNTLLYAGARARERAAEGKIDKIQSQSVAKGKGKGIKILFFPISFSNFSSNSLNDIVSGPVHSIILE